MNINQKIASSSYLLIILTLFMINLINAQNSAYNQTKRNIFHELYQLYIPKKIAADQIGILCYTIFKTIGITISAKGIKDIIWDGWPLTTSEFYESFVFIAIASLLGESMYKDYQNLYAQKNTLTEKPKDSEQNSDSELDLDTDINTDSDSVINDLEFSS